MLRELPCNKASGYDAIPNELIKNASTRFKHYLLIFLNQILQDGVVPQTLNNGKCMLIHKVNPANMYQHYKNSLCRVETHYNPKTIAH